MKSLLFVGDVYLCEERLLSLVGSEEMKGRSCRLRSVPSSDDSELLFVFYFPRGKGYKYFYFWKSFGDFPDLRVIGNTPI